MRPTPPEVLQLARRQDGIVSRRQLRALGHSYAWIAGHARAWLRVLPGVYCVDLHAVADRRRLSWRARLWAGLCFAGDGAVAGGLAAAYLHGLVDQPPVTIELAIPHGTRRRVRQEGYVFAPRAAMSPVLDSCQRGLTTPSRIRSRLRDRSRHRWRGLLEALLADVEDGSTTQLELAYVRAVERPHGLPTARRQVRQLATGAISDNDYGDFDTIVELDGRRGHVEDGAFRDMDRDNLHTVRGKATLRFGWGQVAEQPCRVAQQVGALLRQRGWNGTPTTCRWCRVRTDRCA
ncbi:hypothetical protein [Arsenicicoccus sp. oral taxon 190]|uniref:hypothetical protein n=1 Tax=Arsenicicoccus sp. oral taxon 190 TaxID=1658671 RepID=UPI00067DA726|nr:hypothetical protein [Arsenicicoccus sp. oral taxon 190]